jgi:hypothetical protein
MNWFLRLPPDIQVALVLQACGLIFGCGVWWATVSSLKGAVIEVKKTQAEHGRKLEEHSAELVRLATVQEAGAGARRHGGR